MTASATPRSNVPTKNGASGGGRASNRTSTPDSDNAAARTVHPPMIADTQCARDLYHLALRSQGRRPLSHVGTTEVARSEA